MINRIIRSRRRTLSLQVTAEAELIIRAPHRVSLETIHDAVRQKLPWILKRQQWAKQNWRPPEHKKFAEGEDFHYLGQPYKLGILKDCAEPLTFDGSRFLLAESCATEARAHFIAWYRRPEHHSDRWAVPRLAKRKARFLGRNRASAKALF
ncbi:MAG: YgjP-like metallopeptidase domain-containing protein [Candidatus Omnitrophota bacterium]